MQAHAGGRECVGTCEGAGGVEIVPLQRDAACAHILVECQRLGCPCILHSTACKPVSWLARLR